MLLHQKNTCFIYPIKYPGCFLVIILDLVGLMIVFSVVLWGLWIMFLMNYIPFDLSRMWFGRLYARIESHCLNDWFLFSALLVLMLVKYFVLWPNICFLVCKCNLWQHWKIVPSLFLSIFKWGLFATVSFISDMSPIYRYGIPLEFPSSQILVCMSLSMY